MSGAGAIFCLRVPMVASVLKVLWGSDATIEALLKHLSPSLLRGPSIGRHAGYPSSDQCP